MNAQSLVSDWDSVAECLVSDGVATLTLTAGAEATHARAINVARKAFERIHENPSTIITRIPESADASHATGYHTAGGSNSLSRYNAHREGFIFSNNEMFDVEGVAEFQTSLTQLAHSLHSIADVTLEALERYLKIPTGWFHDKLGPMRESSQFHVKRYSDGVSNTEDAVLLPMHTDPSLVSVVIHDARGVNLSAMGLQCFAIDKGTGKRNWQEVPRHGHAVAVIFVGSIFSHITGHAIKSVKHRVVKCGDPSERVAATLFLRPQLHSKLIIPPSPRFKGVRLKNESTFKDWIERVSRNYGKRNKKSNSN